MQYLGYDLRCTKDDAELHVEVKGSTVGAIQVELTANEVAHAKDYPEAVLAVVDQIRIDLEDGEPIGSGGEVSILEPWELDDEMLLATRFVYRL